MGGSYSVHVLMPPQRSWLPTRVIPIHCTGIVVIQNPVGYPKKGTPKRIDPILNLSSRGVVLEWRNYIDKSEIMCLLLQSSRLKLTPAHHQCSIDFTGIMVLQISDLQPTDSSYGKNEKLLKQKGRATLIGTNLLDAISWATERARAVPFIWMTTSHPLHISPDKTVKPHHPNEPLTMLLSLIILPKTLPGR